jgi:hypothetical protein
MPDKEGPTARFRDRPSVAGRVGAGVMPAEACSRIQFPHRINNHLLKTGYQNSNKLPELSWQEKPSCRKMLVIKHEVHQSI